MKKTKYIKILFIFCLLFAITIISFNNVYAATSSKLYFCQRPDILRMFKIIGIIISIVKILVPIVLIFSAIARLTKVIISGKDDDMKKSVGGIIKSAIAGIIVFLLPSALNYVFTELVNFDDSSYTACSTCLFDASNCKIPDSEPDVYSD